jgi:hypothetical protein
MILSLAKAEGSGAPRGASNQCRAAPAHVAMSRHLGRGARTFGARSPSGAPHAALAGALTSRLSSRPCFLSPLHSGRYPLACKPSAGTAPPAAVLMPQGVMPKAARERFARPRAGAAPCSANKIASGMRPSNEQGDCLLHNRGRLSSDCLYNGDVPEAGRGASTHIRAQDFRHLSSIRHGHRSEPA